MPRREETERQCALTREVKPIAELIRFAVSPDGEVVPDTDGKAEGRGVWISLGLKTVAEAQKKKAFAKSLKAEVKVPDDLAGLTRRRLEERLLSSLSLARKAGQLVTGSTKVKAAIEAGDVVGLFTATDAAEDGRNKLLGSLKGYTKAAEEAGFRIARFRPNGFGTRDRKCDTCCAHQGGRGPGGSATSRQAGSLHCQLDGLFERRERQLRRPLSPTIGRVQRARRRAFAGRFREGRRELHG